MNPFTLPSAGVANGMSVAGFGGAGADGGGTGLASHAAQMGFARGAQMQQQQLSQGHDGRLALDAKGGAVKSRIRDVWKHNLAHEMAVLRQLVDKYPYISMVRRRTLIPQILWGKENSWRLEMRGMPLLFYKCQC
jgi:CCR4-NOT transcription complex subunit 7/8